MLPGSQDENKYICSPIFGYPALPFLAMIECAGYGIIDLYRLTCRYIGHGMQELPLGTKADKIHVEERVLLLRGWVPYYHKASSCVNLVPNVVPWGKQRL